MRHRLSTPSHPLATLALAAVFALTLAAGTVACAPEATETAAETSGDTAEPADYADRMAEEHAGDEPVASGSAEGAPRMEVDGESVVYATGGPAGDAEISGYLARPKVAHGPRALVVIHEWWGLNDNIRQMTDRLAGEGYAALAVDLYGGQTADSPETARELVSSVDQAAALDNLSQALSYLEDELGAEEIGVIGWCFGGGKSLQLALAEPGRVDAAVVYYGQPITEATELEALEAPLLGIFGAEDGGIPVDAVREMESTLEELGKDAQIHIYDGAGHAFANPSGTRYVPEAATDAWNKTTRFLADHLGGEDNR